MALTFLPTAPTTTGVTQVRDFSPQLSDATKANAAAVQNAFKFGTNVHDYMVSREQGKLLEDENDRQRRLQENIANDELLLIKLIDDLAELKNNDDGSYQLRKGAQLLPQNTAPTTKRAFDLLASTDKVIESPFNFRPSEVE